jgi:AraC-like DNA-binding protein
MRHTDLTYKITDKRQTAGYSFNTNDYDRVQLIYVLEGCLHYEGHKPDNKIDLGPNMLVLLRRGDRFRLSCTEEGYRGLGVLVDGGREQALTGWSVTASADRPVRLLTEMILRHMAAPVSESVHVLPGLGQALIWEALALSRERDQRPAHEWAEAVRTVLELHAGAGIAVSDALASLPLSSRQLCRHFRERYGTSPKAYQNLMRIDEARRMLLETQMEITAISVELGYSSSQHFASQFRRLVGCAPSAYRRDSSQAHSTTVMRDA